MNGELSGERSCFFFLLCVTLVLDALFFFFFLTWSISSPVENTAMEG
jgi:hypothetical protein